jgi:hypothetical protein
MIYLNSGMPCHYDFVIKNGLALFETVHLGLLTANGTRLL